MEHVLITPAKRRARVLTSFTFAMALVLGTLATAFAALVPVEQAKSKQGFFGTVTAKTETSLTLKTTQGDKLVFNVTGGTRFRAPGEAQISLKDIAEGSRVAVLAEDDANARNALTVMLIPGEPQREHRALVVTEVSGKTVVAQDLQGNRITVELDHELSADVRGQLITFIGARSKRSDRFKANVEVKIEQVVKRLERHAKSLSDEAKAETRSEEKAKKERALEEVKGRLEANMQRHLDLFAEVVARAPEQARAPLQAALEKTRGGFKAELEALGEAREKAEAKLGLRTLVGSVETVNQQAGLVAIATHGESRVTLKVTGETKIFVDDKAGTLADLSTGARVKVRYAAQTMVAHEIRVELEVEAEGTIQSVDSAKGTITIALTNGALLTLKITGQTRIELNGKKVTASDLKANARAEVEYNAKELVAITIEAQNTAEVEGTIKSVDMTAGKIVISTEDGKEVTILVTEATRVNIRGLRFGLPGLKAGMNIEALFDLTTGVATEMQARDEREGKAKAHPEAKGSGTIASVNTATGEVTLNLDGGGTLVVRLGQGTQIKLGGARGDLSQLKVGDRVRVEYDSETKVASAMEARSTIEAGQVAEFHGTIEKIDAANHKLVLRQGEGVKLEVGITPYTVIRIGGQPSTEADLRMGMQVEAQYRTDTGVSLRITTPGKVESELHGTIEVVDTAAHKMVVRLRSGASLTLTISGDTVMRVNGRVSGESGLKKGMEVEVSYSADTNTALRIIATERAEAFTSVSGTLKAVNLPNGTITVTTEAGQGVTLTLAATSKVEVGGAGSTAAALASNLGAQVVVKFNSETKVISEIKVRGERAGDQKEGQDRQPFLSTWRIYTEAIFFDAGGNNFISPVTTQLELKGDGIWQFGSSSGRWRVAPIETGDWRRWETEPYGPTRKMTLDGWNRSTAEGPVEESTRSVDFFWVIYRVALPQPATIQIKFRRP